MGTDYSKHLTNTPQRQQREASAKHGFDGFIEKQLQLLDENGSLARELSKLHAFYCENCQNDIPHGQA